MSEIAKLINYLQNFHRVSHGNGNRPAPSYLKQYAFRDIRRVCTGQLHARTVLISHNFGNPRKGLSTVLMNYMDATGAVHDLAHILAVEMHALLGHNVYFDLCQGNLTIFTID